MDSLSDRINRWVRDDVIDAQTAERIRAYEARRPAEPEGAGMALLGEDRPGVLEALTYLGVIVVAIGVAVLVGQNWDELESWARIAAIGVPAVAFLVIGLSLLRFEDRGLQRGGQLALLAAHGLVGGTAAVMFSEAGYLDGDDRGAILLLSVIVLAAGAALWALSPEHPQVLGLGGAAFFFAQATGNWPDAFSPELAGSMAVAIAAVALTLAELNLFTPRPSARFVFAALALFGALMTRFETAFAWEFLILAVGVTFIALSIWRRSFIYMIAGVVGVFLGLITFVFEHFSEQLGAPLALMLTGALVLAAVVILAQGRTLVHRSPAP